jgi:hypothetical protein
LKLAPTFSISAVGYNSARLDSAIGRYQNTLGHTQPANDAAKKPTLKQIEIQIATDASEALDITTPYDYKLIVSDATAKVFTSSIYGAMYAMETFTHLVAGELY